MSDLEAAETRLSFDDILEAVQDSKRGRWFLQEFEARLQKRDTQIILKAISRLEARMEDLGPQASNPEDLNKVRAAIVTARNDLIKLGLGKDALSKEGRLFAEMAEMAKKAMPATVNGSAGIVRSLQLVAEIESTIAPANPDQGSRYFIADANLFERPATAAKPVLVQAPEIKKEEPAATGAKLVIRRANQTPEPEATRPQEVPATPLTPDMPTIDNPRIVIIRRRAEDMADFGENDALDNVSAA